MLKELCKKHGAHKGDDKLSEHFMKTYEQHFSPYKDSAISLLEIGIQSGGSLKMWAEYFPKAKITGVDIKDKCRKHETDRISVLVGDQEDRSFLSICGQYDIIIDDGGHTMLQQKTSLKYLWHHLNAGGIYVLEDLETSYWPQFKGGYGRGKTTIEKLKERVDNLNSMAIGHKRAEKYRLVVPHMNLKSIHFYPSLCFLYKR